MDHMPRTTVITDVTDLDYDSMEQFRAATSSPSIVSELLSDPTYPRPIRPSSRRGSSSSSRDSKRRDRSSEGSGSMRSAGFEDDDRHSTYLKSLLNSTNERVLYESRRAEQAELRADRAGSLARDSQSRAMQADLARHQVEIELARAREEIKRHKFQLEVAERELRRAEVDIETLEQQRNDAEQMAQTERDSARQYQSALRDLRAREEGREEGRRLGLRRGYTDGKTSGWKAGKAEGFEEGREFGMREGREEGESEGRVYERKRALESFDRFIDSQSGMSDVRSISTLDRTQQWAYATEQTAKASTPIPGSPRPSAAPTTPRPMWMNRLQSDHQ